jgi:hypothetical protein
MTHVVVWKMVTRRVNQGIFFLSCWETKNKYFLLWTAIPELISGVGWRSLSVVAIGNLPATSSKRVGAERSKTIEQSLFDLAPGNEVQVMWCKRNKQQRQNWRKENPHFFLPSRARTMTLARRFPLMHSMLNYLSSIWNSTSPSLPPQFAPPAQTSPAPTPPSSPAVVLEMTLLLAVVAKQSVVDSTEKERFKYSEAQP